MSIKKYGVVCLLSFLCVFSAMAQIHINWNTLVDVKFEQQFSVEMGITSNASR